MGVSGCRFAGNSGWRLGADRGQGRVNVGKSDWVATFILSMKGEGIYAPSYPETRTLTRP